MKLTFTRAARVLTAAILASAPLKADVRLPSIFSDGVVLQREKRVQIFGFATPGEVVRVRASWGFNSEDAFTDQDGRWSTTIVTPAAGGPFTLEVRGKNVVKVSDVYAGEVWLCSGQSNMEMSIAAREGGYTGVLDWQREVAAAENPLLHLFTVGNAVAPAPRDDVQGRWSASTPETAGAFSATAWFFGRMLQRELGVPVGLVASDYGGTPAEAWTSGITLASFPEFADQVARLEREARAPAAAALEHEREVEAWLGAIEEIDHGLRDGFAQSAFDDSSWATADVPGALGGELARHDGVFWLRRAFTLPEGIVPRAATIALGPIDNFDTTFVDGVQIGSAADLYAFKTPRAYPLPPELATPGRHVITVRVVDTGGPGGILGNANDLRVKLGTESVALSGAWRVRAGESLRALPRRPTQIDLVPYTPTALYNAMIAPLVRFSFKGVIWYQGESNCTRAAQYRTLFPALIADWRARFGAIDWPFYFVQIAPYAYAGDNGEASELREAQRLALAVPHTGMVVTSDIGDANDIHPKNKQEVGRRLGLWALANTYGRAIECSGPLLRSVTIERDPQSGAESARLVFDHAAGLRIAENAATPIEVEIAPGQFAPADVRIEGDAAILTHASGHVASVRSGTSATSGPALTNGAGLPASSFRSSTAAWITDHGRVDASWKRAGNDLTLAAPIASAIEGIPLGNGLTGALVWGAGHDLTLALDRSDAWDLRSPARARDGNATWKRLTELVAAGDESALSQEFDAPYTEASFPAKLALPSFHVRLDGVEVTSFTLDLAQCEARVAFSHGAARAFVSAAAPIVMLRVDGIELADTFWQGIGFESRAALDRAASPVGTRDANGASAEIAMPGGGSFGLVAHWQRTGGGLEIAIAIVDGSESSKPIDLASERALQALEIGYGRLLGQHIAMANAAGGGATVSLPEPLLQTQYELARYLMLSGSRRGAPPLARQGVWTVGDARGAWKGEYQNFDETPRTYGACATAGLFESEVAYLEFLWKLGPELHEFAREFYGVDGAVLPGSLALDGTPLLGPSAFAFSPASGAWAIESFARHFACTQDREFLERRAYPWCSAIAEASIALAPGDARHPRKLALSSSPSFAPTAKRAWLAPNSNYDLALMRSAFENLAQLASALGRSADAARWKQVSSEFEDFDLDARGALTIARGEPYAASQRALSHALAIHPLGLVSIEGGARERAIVDATLDEILEQGTSAWNGSTCAALACLAARAGRPETALRALRDFERGFTFRNGLHCGGDRSGEALASSRDTSFTIAGNMLAQQAVHEMLLQSWGGVVRVFPSVSTAWRDVAFDGLWADGGFVVSARRTALRTQEVRVRATSAARLRLRDPFAGSDPVWNRNDVQRSGSDWVVTLQPGDELVGTRAVPR